MVTQTQRVRHLVTIFEKEMQELPPKALKQYLLQCIELVQHLSELEPRVLEHYLTFLNKLPSNWIGNGFEGLHNLPPNVLKKYQPKCTELLQHLSEMEPRVPENDQTFRN